MKNDKSLKNIVKLSSPFFESFFAFGFLTLLEPAVSKKATAGTMVIAKQAEPKLQATPNSVILTPCLKKLRIVVVSSGIKLPIATTMPVISQLRPYLFDILTKAGIKKLSAINAKVIRK